MQFRHFVYNNIVGTVWKHRTGNKKSLDIPVCFFEFRLWRIRVMNIFQQARPNMDFSRTLTAIRKETRELRERETKYIREEAMCPSIKGNQAPVALKSIWCQSLSRWWHMNAPTPARVKTTKEHKEDDFHLTWSWFLYYLFWYARHCKINS